jgi:hypothetical protein
MVQDAQNVDPRAFFDGWVGAHLAVYAELHARRHGRT